MKSRYYLGVLIVILTVLGGLAGHQHNRMHNQVAVFHFSETSIDSQKSKHLIDAVKAQLVEEGAENIIVFQNEKGAFILKYFSKKSTETVENGISQISALELNRVTVDLSDSSDELPFDENETFEFKIYEIQNWHDLDPSMDQSAAIIVKSDFLRFSLTLDPYDLINYKLETTSYIVDVNLKCQRELALHINDISNIIPEVRAGPLNLGIG